MKDKALINELLSIEASASLLMQRAARLREHLQPVSTGSTLKSRGLSEIQKAKLLENKRKSINKKTN